MEQEPQFSPEQIAGRQALLAKLRAGCTEAEFQAMLCPICGGAVAINVHPKGKKFSVRCSTRGFCLVGQEECGSPPPWFKKHLGGCWMTSEETRHVK